MSLTVGELVEEAKLEISGKIVFGEYDALKNNISNRCGIYLISAPEQWDPIWQDPFSDFSLVDWKRRYPKLHIVTGAYSEDGTPPNLRKYLGQFMDEQLIVYIGCTNDIRRRIRQLSIHNLGDKRPHSGGQWVKTLRRLNELEVYWCETNNYEQIKTELLKKFRIVTGKFPFANIKEDEKKRSIKN